MDDFTLEHSRCQGESNDSAVHINGTNTRIIQSSFQFNAAGTFQSHVELTYIKSVNFHINLQPYIQSNGARIGGALLVTNSTVNISSSYFERNAANLGGAIFSQIGSNINIRNCTFVKNGAMGCSDDGCHGGALFIDSGCTVATHNS